MKLFQNEKAESLSSSTNTANNTQTTEVQIDITNSTFVFARKPIAKGTAVTWVNNGSAPHTANGISGEYLASVPLRDC